MAYCGIYLIHNTTNDKTYIGSSVNIQKRWGQHVSALNIHKHHNGHLQHAWEKYGQDAFTYRILEVVLDRTKLHEREQFYINLLKPEYNIAQDVIGHMGLHPSEETRKKLSVAKQGEKNGGSKLSAEQVLEIRSLFSVGDITLTALGSLYGVCRSTISNIVNRKRWKSVK